MRWRRGNNKRRWWCNLPWFDPWGHQRYWHFVNIIFIWSPIFLSMWSLDLSYHHTKLYRMDLLFSFFLHILYFEPYFSYLLYFCIVLYILANILLIIILMNECLYFKFWHNIFNKKCRVIFHTLFQIHIVGSQFIQYKVHCLLIVDVQIWKTKLKWKKGTFLLKSSILYFFASYSL